MVIARQELHDKVYLMTFARCKPYSKASIEAIHVCIHAYEYI